MLVSLFVRQQARPTIKTQNHDDLVALKQLVEAGRVTPVIDGAYPLSDVPTAMARVATGHARGTVVITMPGAPVESPLVNVDGFGAPAAASAAAS
jgi:NADPH:quinone reductase-like Zn-dependent oxidoreductase